MVFHTWIHALLQRDIVCGNSNIPGIYVPHSHTYIVGPMETCAEVETLHLHEHVYSQQSLVVICFKTLGYVT